PGIGYKMGSNLLKKFPSIEDILDNIDSISKMKFRGSRRIQELVEQHQDILPRNKLLTTIITDADFKGPKESLRWEGINEAALHNMFDLLNAAPSRRNRWFNLQPV
ncbi:MAG: hypothetical protein KAJ92_09585, partial [Gammaproteobacteria bacterium]|nr:hypothetical protein [Gammaproteobacteria bacterium]